MQESQLSFARVQRDPSILTDIVESDSTVTSWVTSIDISGRLALDLSQKAVSGAHWFKVADFWFRLNHGYNNPLNAGCVHSELLQIYQNRIILSDFLHERTLVFLGIGVGDTEMAVVDAQIDSTGYSESILIDINPEFLRLFLRSLHNRKIEDSYVIRYAAYRALFETIPVTSSLVSNARYAHRALVCLGSTIGNYQNLHEPFEIFSKMSEKGDRLFLSYQLNRELKRVFLKYAGNPLFRDLIGNFLQPEERSRIEWVLNEKNSFVEAWLGDVQLFRSKKFESGEVACQAAKRGWKEVFCVVDRWENLCLHGFEKT